RAPPGVAPAPRVPGASARARPRTPLSPRPPAHLSDMRLSVANKFASGSLSFVLFDKRQPQPAHGLRHARLHRADRDPQPTADLRVSHLLDVAHLEDQAVALRQRGDGAADACISVLLHQERLRLWDPERARSQGLVHRLFTQLPAELLSLIE